MKTLKRRLALWFFKDELTVYQTHSTITHELLALSKFDVMTEIKRQQSNDLMLEVLLNGGMELTATNSIKYNTIEVGAKIYVLNFDKQSLTPVEQALPY